MAGVDRDGERDDGQFSGNLNRSAGLGKPPSGFSKEWGRGGGWGPAFSDGMAGEGVSSSGASGLSGPIGCPIRPGWAFDGGILLKGLGGWGPTGFSPFSKLPGISGTGGASGADPGSALGVSFRVGVVLGFEGTSGRRGASGTGGVSGTDGVWGTPGASGTNGASGALGASGPPGAGVGSSTGFMGPPSASARKRL